MKVFLCLVILLSGCHRGHYIVPEELRKLDGFRKGDEVRLTLLSGRVIAFSADTPLLIVVPGRTLYAKYVEIEIEGSMFRGKTAEGHKSSVNIDEVSAAAVDVGSGSGWSIFGWTMVGVGGVVAVAIVAAVVLVIVAIVIIVGLVLDSYTDYDN